MPSEIVYHQSRGSDSLGCRATYHPLITLQTADRASRGYTGCTFAINHPLLEVVCGGLAYIFNLNFKHEIW